MARIKLSPVLSDIKGSVGGITFQNSQGGITSRSQPLSLNAQTSYRETVKGYINQVMCAWSLLTTAQKNTWESYIKLVPQYQKSDKSRALTGYTLFLRYNLVRLQAGVEMLTETPLVSPNEPVIDFSITSGEFVRNIMMLADDDSIAYSEDGINWTGLGKSVFSTRGQCVCWNGSMFVAGGLGTNSLAYSSDGINWTGLGTSIFSSNCNTICWNGSMFVAGGQGTNSLAYSSDGINWTGLGTSIFSYYGTRIAWNGSMFVAGGWGTNSIAYSSDGINWTGLGTTIFSINGRQPCWNGSIWVMAGYGTNSLAYSSDGINWTGLGTSVFSQLGWTVCWNGSIFVAGGQGSYKVAYSSDGINWTQVSQSIFTARLQFVSYNGNYFLGSGSSAAGGGYSADGINWYPISGLEGNTSSWGSASTCAPFLYPPFSIIPNVNFGVDLSHYNMGALFKISRFRNSQIGYQKNKTRVIQLGNYIGQSYPIDTQYLNRFGLVLKSGVYVHCSYRIFSLLYARVWPEMGQCQVVANV